MNKILVDVAIKRKIRNRYGCVADNAGKIDLEKIVMGDVVQRDKNREKYLSEQFEERLSKVIGS